MSGEGEEMRKLDIEKIVKALNMMDENERAEALDDIINGVRSKVYVVGTVELDDPCVYADYTPNRVCFSEQAASDAADDLRSTTTESGCNRIMVSSFW